MTGFNAFFAAVSAVLLFLYGLQGFSRELQSAGGTLLQTWLGRVTRNRWIAFGIEAGATALVQSSSAVSALTVALVESGVISFRSSLGGAARAEPMRETLGWGPSIGDELHRRGIQAGRRSARHPCDASGDHRHGTRSSALDDRITGRLLHDCLASRCI